VEFFFPDIIQHKTRITRIYRDRFFFAPDKIAEVITVISELDHVHNLIT